MSKVPMGKVLLRNVIRHTDAHNKIQEESEMWKRRDKELKAHVPKHRWMTSGHSPRNNMHCDRYLDDSEGSVEDRLSKKKCLSDKDDGEACYWTRKLYEFEANDPDRWGHSGFKELYPEDFQSDGEMDCTNHRRKNGKEKTAIDKHKSSKKSSKRKKKKKKKKKRQRTEGSGSESDHSALDSVRRKQKRKSGKKKHGRKKELKSEVREEEDSSTVDSEPGRKAKIAHKRRHRTAADSQSEPERKKRKNWKANEEKSEESSEE